MSSVSVWNRSDAVLKVICRPSACYTNFGAFSWKGLNSYKPIYPMAHSDDASSSTSGYPRELSSYQCAVGRGRAGEHISNMGQPSRSPLKKLRCSYEMGVVQLSDG